MKNLVNKIVLVIAAISISLLSFTQQQFPIKIQFLNNEGSPVSDTTDISINNVGLEAYTHNVGWWDDGDGGQSVSISINTNIIDSISIFNANNDILSPTFIGIKSSTTVFDFDVYKYNSGDIVSTSNTEIEYNSTYYADIRIQHGSTEYLYNFKIKFIEDNTASVVENEISVSDVLVYPNPVINNLTVEFEAINSDIPVEVYSFNGHLMFVDNDYRSFGSNKVSIDMSDYPSGMYMVRLGNEVKKVIK